MYAVLGTQLIYPGYVSSTSSSLLAVTERKGVVAIRLPIESYTIISVLKPIGRCERSIYHYFILH